MTASSVAAPVRADDISPAMPRSAVTPAVLIVIAAGGAVGALARYGLARAWQHQASGFPWATFTTNVTGCLLIGILMAVITDLVRPHRLVRPFLGVGVLGGFTTFSTYTVETQTMVAAGAPRTGLLYLAATPLAALLAVALGAAVTRSFGALVRTRQPGVATSGHLARSRAAAGRPGGAAVGPERAARPRRTGR